MRCLVPQHQHEGLLSTLLLSHPINCHVCDNRGVVAGNHFSLAIVGPKLRVKIFPLSPVRHEVIKARTLAIVRFTHVPLTNVGRGISRTLKLTRKGRKILRIVREIIHHPVRMRIQPTQNRSPARRAQGSRAEVILEQDPFRRQLVNPGRLQMRMPHTTQSIGPLVIGQNENYIGTSRFSQAH